MTTKHIEDRHWTADELLNLLYGLQPDDSSRMTHLDGCESCSRRWTELQAKRVSLTEDPVIPASVLRNQRLAIEAELSAPASWRAWLRPVPALAAGLLFIVGLALNQPRPEAQEQTVAAVTDTQLFTEIASVADQTAPRAADPIQALFLEQEVR